MRDFNFFSSSLKEVKRIRRKQLLISICILIFILIIGGLYMMTTNTRSDIEDEILTLKVYIDSPEVAAKALEIKEKKVELEVLLKYHDTLQAVKIDLENSDVINSELLETVNSTIPQGIFFRNIMLSSGIITINGLTDSRVSVAEFYHNLKELGIFYEINVGAISYIEIIEEGVVVSADYTFDIQCMLKGGADK